jgi:hypothetical protein
LLNAIILALCLGASSVLLRLMNSA